MSRTAQGRIAPPERFRDCVHCGLCLEACPTYVELGTEMDSPRGRIQLMRGLQEGTVTPTAEVVRHLDLCLGCRACETACPAGVHYGELIEGTRAWLETRARRPWKDRLWRRALTRILPQRALLEGLVAPLRMLERFRLLNLVRRLVPSAALLPRLEAAADVPPVVPARGEARARVALLAGCVAPVLFPGTQRATVEVLSRNGCTVDTPPGQGCCGALALHAGDVEAARAAARRNLEVFVEGYDAILTNAAGCGAMLKEYGALLADDPVHAETARRFSARVRDVLEFLAERPLAAPMRPLPRHRVTYHDACHLAHGQGVRQAPRQLLQQIPGVEFVELSDADTCCGSAGSYNLTEPAMAARLGERKAAAVLATGAEVVAAANPGCVMQIQAHLARQGRTVRVCHPIDLLAEACRAADRS